MRVRMKAGSWDLHPPWKITSSIGFHRCYGAVRISNFEYPFGNFDIQNRALKVSLDIKNLIFRNFPNAKLRRFLTLNSGSSNIEYRIGTLIFKIVHLKLVLKLLT